MSGRNEIVIKGYFKNTCLSLGKICALAAESEIPAKAQISKWRVKPPEYYFYFLINFNV
jgi:hypothetical protein